MSTSKWPSKDGLRFGHLNICHAINKTLEITTILNNQDNPFHIFGFSESWLTDMIFDADITISGYILVHRHRKHVKETGLLLYISESIQFKRLYHLEQYQIESIWIEISIKHSSSIILGFIYRHPDENINWIDNFTSMIDAVLLESKDYFILGDFNIDLLKSNKTWTDRVQLCNLEQLITIPTRVTATSSTLIDHIYVSNKAHIIEVCVPVYGCSDHFPVCMTWKKKGVKIPKPGHKTISYRSYSKFNEKNFLQDLIESTLQNVYNFSNPEDALNSWYNTFMFIYDKHVPIVTRRVKHYSKPPWLDNELQQAIQLRDKFKKFKKEIEFKKQRNYVTSLKRKKIKSFIQELLTNNTNSKEIWKAINALTNKQQTSTVIRDIAPEILNIHFATTSDRVITVDKSGENTLQKLKHFCMSKNINDTNAIPFMTTNNVYKYLINQRKTNSRGIDEIDGKILKLSAPIITDTLTFIYNLCIDKSHFPSLLKQAKVIPLFKSGSLSDPSNYRPISILSVLAKPLEKHINHHLLDHFNCNNLLNPNQSGFRAKHSCHTSLTSMTEQWLKNINDNKFSGALFVDFAKAFDVIDHFLLLRKLELYGLKTKFLQLINSFLSGREQLVCINNIRSNLTPVTTGVPQGTVLGPLLFSIYINDLPLHLSVPCELFADDTTLHTGDTNLTSLASNLQKGANELQTWTEQNHMALNPNKIKSMLITNRQKRQNLTIQLPLISICNKVIEEVQNHKVLGVILDNNLSWKGHISHISKCISRKLFQLSRIKHFINLNSRKTFYCAHIQSLIDYSSTLWDSASGQNMKPLLSVQKRAIKTILSKTVILSSDYAKLNILPVLSRLKFNKGVFMHKILSGNAPTYLSNLLIRNARIPHKLNIPVPRLDLYKSSLVYSGSLLWNSLPYTIRNPNCIHSFFKHKLYKYLQTSIC